MKIVPINEILGYHRNGEEAGIGWDRHIPDDCFEKALLTHAITNSVWRWVRADRRFDIPVKLFDAVEGRTAKLLLPEEPQWRKSEQHDIEDWDDKGWDDEGRLQGTIKVGDDDDPFSNNLPDESFPIFYSVMSSLDTGSTRILNVVFEFASTPYSQKDQTNLSANGNRGQRMLPSLVVPPSDTYYKKRTEMKPRTVDRGDAEPHISEWFPDKESYENWIDSSD